VSLKAAHRVWLAVALVVAFVLGIGARQLVLDADFNATPEASVAPVTVRVQTPDDIRSTRAAVVGYLFGSPSLPTALPVDNGDGTYTVTMANGITSLVRLHEPASPNGRLVLYHAGHGGYGAPDAMVVDDLVAGGDTVLVFEMPLIGVNAAPIHLDLPNGPVTLTRHEHMAFLDGVTTGSPIRYFVEPVIVMLNAFAPKYDDISMIGLSGGGWTTTMAAAIDPRIDRSYQAAGTLPMAVRFAREDSWGDYEQVDPGLYAIADYPDLYVLGAAGRRQIQVLNLHDPCCFGGDHRAIYEPQVQAALQAAGGGFFSVYLDPDNTEHSISRAALTAIEADIAANAPSD
jgi:hypothetical protein